jgi:tetratricopeptide (TPR) repeat protein
MPEVLVLIIGLGLAGAAVLLPLRRATSGAAPADDGLDAVRLRHRVALEALRDVEADRRAGSLDDAAYAAQLAEAESRAATTRAALDAAGPAPRSHVTSVPRAVPVAVAVLIGGALVAASLVPATGIANQTVVNQELAATEAAEDARQARIGELTAQLAASPDDTDTLSALADAYLAGSTEADLVAAANALQVLIALEPDRADAYERIIAAYLRAGDQANARAAHASYAVLDSADPVEVAFLDGLIALRGEGDSEAARAAFDRFLELAPDDPRATMVEALRDEASGG